MMPLAVSWSALVKKSVHVGCRDAIAEESQTEKLEIPRILPRQRFFLNSFAGDKYSIRLSKCSRENVEDIKVQPPQD